MTAPACLRRRRTARGYRRSPSCVRRAEDIADLPRRLSRASVRIVAQDREKDTALAERRARCIAASDAVMVARGDLGVELPLRGSAAGAEGLIRLAVAASHGRSSSRRRCSTRWSTARAHPRRRRRTWPTPSSTAPTPSSSSADGGGGIRAEAVEALDRIIREIERHPELRSPGAGAAGGSIGRAARRSAPSAACAAAQVARRPSSSCLPKSGSQRRVRGCRPTVGADPRHDRRRPSPGGRWRSSGAWCPMLADTAAQLREGDARRAREPHPGARLCARRGRGGGDGGRARSTLGSTNLMKIEEV